MINQTSFPFCFVVGYNLEFDRVWRLSRDVDEVLQSRDHCIRRTYLCTKLVLKNWTALVLFPKSKDPTQ